MNEKDELDLTGILPLLDGTEAFEDSSMTGDATAETLRRLELETLGLLVHSLDPVMPSGGARARLLAALAEEPFTTVQGLAPVVSLSAVRAERATPLAAPYPRRGWGLAASILIGLFGFGTAGWLHFERSKVEDELARVTREREQLITELRGREKELSAERAVRVGEVGRRNEALSVVSSRGVAICPLRPVGATTTLQPDSFAMLYMAQTQKSWYVKASHLAPAPAGRTYRVWFETDHGSMLVGELRPAPDLDLQFEAAAFRAVPMTGVKVTLEPMGQATEPTGPMVLFGSDKMMVL